MASLTAFLDALSAPVDSHRPWRRYPLDYKGYWSLVQQLACEEWSLIGLWGDIGDVHMALRDETDGILAVASLSCPDSRFPSVSTVRPSAIRLERAIQDLFGMTAQALTDPRPWLDHDNWPVRNPLSASPSGALTDPPAYRFLPVDGEGLHQIPVGPVHAGIIEPGHFRFHANGETIVRLEERLGYTHKGLEFLMRGRSVEDAARIAARVSGDSTVAYGMAFARAVEAALDLNVSPRAHALRGLMAELERLANHFGDIGAIGNDVAFAFMHSECGMLREKVLCTADVCFGHRLMMDRIVPGGTSVDLAEDGPRRLHDLLTELRKRFRPLTVLYRDKASLLDRTVRTGIVTPALARLFGAGGFIGRASGRGHDARRSPGYAPYDRLAFDVPVLSQGDVHARVWIRIREVEVCFSLIHQILVQLPEGPHCVELPRVAGEGMSLVEGFRGEILMWVRLAADGRVLRCHPRDPSWFQWPLLEAAMEGNIVADFPLCNKSFNCSYSGQDL